MPKSKYFTKAEIQELKDIKASQHLISSYRYQYKTHSGFKIDNRVWELYSKITGETAKINFSCPNCSYQFYRKAGALYVASCEHHKVAE